MCVGFQDEIFFRGGGECETPRKYNFSEKGKMVISIKIWNFSRSWMMKRTSPLESSHEIYLPHRILLNSETVGICMFFEATRVVRDTWHILSGSQYAAC